MLNQLQIKCYSHRLQVEFRTLSKFCKKLYHKYAPSRLTNRRNASLVKVPDCEIIALLVWQAEEGISDLPVAMAFVAFPALVSIAELERFLALLLRSSTI